MTARRALVVGATGPLGRRVSTRLSAAGYQVHGTYRTERPEIAADLTAQGIKLHPLTLSDDPASADALAGYDLVVMTPILTVSGPVLRRTLTQSGGTKFIASSSNNVVIDFASPVYDALRAEEAALKALSGDLTILRPTMVYGYADDGNISRLVAFAQRYGVLPIPGNPETKQAVIHVDDLAACALHCANLPTQTKPQIYSASMASTPTNRELYHLIASSLGGGVRVITLPRWLMGMLAGISGLLPVRLPLKPDQLKRLQLDRIPKDVPPPPGWTASTDLQTGIKSLVEAMKTTPGP